MICRGCEFMFHRNLPKLSHREQNFLTQYLTSSMIKKNHIITWYSGGQGLHNLALIFSERCKPLGNMIKFGVCDFIFSRFDEQR